MQAMGTRHLERIEWVPRDDVDLEAWPFSLAAVRELADAGGLEVPPGVTFLVGENGSGKSTLVEAFAAVYPRHGAEGDHVNVTGARAQPEDSPLQRHLRAVTHQLASPAGFFLRSEVLHDYLQQADASPGSRYAYDGEQLTRRSHGEAVLTLLRHRFTEPGVYFLDEPEAALSFTSTLGLMVVLDELAQAGCQALVATHSPVVTALPGATLWEVGEWGLRETAWDDLALVADWRTFLADPRPYLRHLFDDRR